MTVSYWRELLTRGEKKDPLSELGYRFSIQTDTNETSSPLKGKHILVIIIETRLVQYSHDKLSYCLNCGVHI